jgi:hypothetical protein
MARVMMRSKRVKVVLSLVGYLLATVGVQALHDHSAHHCSGCTHEARDVAANADCNDCCAEGGHAGEDGDSHHRPHGPTRCEDSCFACRLLAVKGVAPATFTVVENVGVVYLIERRVPAFYAPPRPSLPLSRGPPA